MEIVDELEIAMCKNCTGIMGEGRGAF